MEPTNAYLRADSAVYWHNNVNKEFYMDFLTQQKYYRCI